MSVIEKDGKLWELVKVDSSTVRRKLLGDVPPAPKPVEAPAPKEVEKRGPGRPRKAD